MLTSLKMNRHGNGQTYRLRKNKYIIMRRRAQAIHVARDRRLKSFYKNILRNAQLNFNNKEIQDIQIAVRQMLERVTAQTNADAESRFKISYIQPCGSMEEKSSILKSYWKPYNYNGERLTKYIEFDYLAITDDVRLEGSCPGCHFGLESILKQGDGDKFPLKRGSDDVFNSQFSRSIASLCSCFSPACHIMRLGDNIYLPISFSFERANPNINGCPSCTVTMDTGCLTVMPKVINNDRGGCSLILLWTSYVSSLSDFDCNDTLQTTKQIKYLPIHIDFIPARKISGQQINGSNPLFLVPKTCSYCDEKCRLSDCLSEVEYFLNSVSENHRKTYLIVKFISQFFEYPPKYHLKIILFHHCKICTNTSEDYATCVLSILRELEQSYGNGVLMSFCGNVNLLEVPYEEDHWYEKRAWRVRRLYDDWRIDKRALNTLIKLLSNFKTWTLIRSLSEELWWW